MINQLNRQSAGKNIEVPWLAGITDGDGSIGIHKQPFKGTMTYVPEYSLSTTCEITYQYLENLLNKLEIGHHWGLRKVTNPNWKNRWVLEIRGFKRVSKILELLQPYLITKNKECKLVLEFINSRLKENSKRTYSTQELSLIEQVKQIKKTRNGNL